MVNVDCSPNLGSSKKSTLHFELVLMEMSAQEKTKNKTKTQTG